MHTAARVRNMKESASIAIADLARELKRRGERIINLAVGEPDFDTPAFIKLAAIDALLQGKTKYTNVAGIPELIAAICDKLLRENAITCTPAQILVTSGAKQAIFNALFAVLEPGDEVIVPAPFWVSYPEMVSFAGGRPICVPAGSEMGYKLTPDALASSLSPLSRMLILNSPNNPSGAAYSRKELEQLGEVIRRHPRLLVLCDDIYEHISWQEERFCNLAMARPDLLERIIIVNGVSKAFAMTGWRIGYSAAPVPLTQAMAKIQSQCTTSATSIAQYASVAALNAGPVVSREMVQAFRRRHEIVRAALNAIDGVQCHAAEATFYAFPDVSVLLARTGIASDARLAECWLREAGVAVVPGDAYGLPGHIRLSCAASDEELREAMARVSRLSADQYSAYATIAGQERRPC